MSVYVDDFEAKFRNMVMCHMMADTEVELDEMAGKLKLLPRWKQSATKRFPAHYDISKLKRLQAIGYGAVEITAIELVKRFSKTLKRSAT